MNDHQRSVARKCLSAAYDGSLDFSALVGRLMEAGFESYTVDFRRKEATYYLPAGDTLDLPLAEDAVHISPAFDIGAVKDAIREAQTGDAGYTYEGFCRKIKEAGCAGYIVSFIGRRVVYIGRTGAMHVEHFPQ